MEIRPGSESFKAQAGPLALGSTPGRTGPVAGRRAGGTNRRPAESRDTTREEGMATSLLPKHGRDGGLRRHTAAPEPAPARDRWALQRLASPHSSALGPGLPGPRERAQQRDHM